MGKSLVIKGFMILYNEGYFINAPMLLLLTGNELEYLLTVLNSRISKMVCYHTKFRSNTGVGGYCR